MMRKLTKGVSVLLAVVMLMGVVLCAPFTVSASETDIEAKNPTYNMYSGFYYSNNFNYNTPSFAREYYNQLKSDTGFMVSVTAWESAHIVTSPSYALKSGMINMKDYYKTVIYDLLAQSDSDSGLDKLLNMANNKYLSYVSGVTKKISTAYEIKPDELDKLTVDEAITLTQETGLLKVASVSNVALKIASWVKSAKDTVEAFAKYQAVSDLKDGTKEILEMIANDTNNPSQLRQAAQECIGYFGGGYDEVLNQILEGTRSIASFTFDIIADTALSWAWDLIIGSIATAGGAPVGAAFLFGAKGAMLFTNVLFSTDKEIEAFYKIQAAVAFEDAIKNTIDNLRNNSNITTDDCDAYMYLKATEIFEKTILLGFDYSVDLLEVTGNSAWNKIFGGYSKCMNLIEQIKTFKDNKLNYFKTFEEKCFNAYNSQYCPDYNSLINGLNNQNISIESITLKQTADISVGDSGYIDDFISCTFEPNGYTELSLSSWSSSDNSIIKFNADYYGDYLGDFEALSNGECTLTCTLMSGVSQSITVTVGEEKQYEHNYEGDFEYSIEYNWSKKNYTAVITKYKGNNKTVIIPYNIDGYTVARIDDNAFDINNYIASISIPSTVTAIGSKLNILENFFYNCKNLGKIIVDGNNRFFSSADGVLYNKNKTRLIAFPPNKRPGNSQFIIPDTVNTIGASAFLYCNQIEEITIPKAVTSIEGDAFYGCGQLKTVIIEDLNAWCNITFYRNYNDSYSKIYYSNPLYYAEKLVINGLEVNELTIPDSVESISEYAFYGCKSLTKVFLPQTVNSIGENAFSNCEKLKCIEVNEHNEAYTSLSGVLFDKQLTNIISVPLSVESVSVPASINDIKPYQFSNCKHLTQVILEDGIKEIGSSAFENCTSLTSITIPDSVTSIRGAFRGCTSLTSITIPDSVTSIDHVFIDCTSLTSITIPDSVTSIRGAFRGCTSLTSITIPDSVTSIDCAFRDCTSLTSITIPDSVTSIDGAFENCTSLTSITIPDIVTSIGDSTFEKCTSLTSVTIPDSVIRIGKYAFYKCTGLTSVTIPDSVTSIGFSAFYNCTSLTSVTIPDSVTSIGFSAFYNCTSLTSVTIPDIVTSIGDSTFENCESLAIVKIGNSVTSIGNSTFRGCYNLKYLTIPDSVTSIGDYAFLYDGIKDVYYSGSEEEWNKISIGSYNSSLENATIHFNSEGPLPAETIVDENTGITVTTDLVAEFNVENLTDSDSAKNVIPLLDKSEKLADLYDISLTKDGVAIQPDEPATVKIPTDNENAKVYRIEDNGTKTDMNAVYDNGYMVFTTEHFSLYALVIPNDNVIGDVNGEGVITVEDVTTLQKYLANIVDFDDKQLAVADTNGDGIVNIRDVTQIQQYLANIITSLG